MVHREWVTWPSGRSVKWFPTAHSSPTLWAEWPHPFWGVFMGDIAGVHWRTINRVRCDYCIPSNRLHNSVLVRALIKCVFFLGYTTSWVIDNVQLIEYDRFFTTGSDAVQGGCRSACRITCSSPLAIRGGGLANNWRRLCSGCLGKVAVGLVCGASFKLQWCRTIREIKGKIYCCLYVSLWLWVSWQSGCKFSLWSLI